MDTELEPLMNRPDLPQLVATLNEQLQRERESREAFLRDLTPDMKAEFIGGERILHSLARAEHIRVSRRLLMMLASHVMNHDLGEVLFEKALIHLTRNDYEPDILFLAKKKQPQLHPIKCCFPRQILSLKFSRNRLKSVIVASSLLTTQVTGLRSTGLSTLTRNPLSNT
jgi:hypothetical protein